jgi:hypothetical protein
MLKNLYFQVFTWWIAKGKEASTVVHKEQVEYASNLGRMPRPWILGEWAKESINSKQTELYAVAEHASARDGYEEFSEYRPELSASYSKNGP